MPSLYGGLDYMSGEMPVSRRRSYSYENESPASGMLGRTTGPSGAIQSLTEQLNVGVGANAGGGGTGVHNWQGYTTLRPTSAQIGSMMKGEQEAALADRMMRSKAQMEEEDFMRQAYLTKLRHGFDLERDRYGDYRRYGR